MGEALPTAVGFVDSISVEATGLRSVTRTVREAGGGQLVMEVRHDSTRGRVRPVGGAWRDLAESLPPPVTVRMRMDDRLRVLDAAVVGADTISVGLLQALRGSAARFEFAFPEAPVAVGQPWTSDVVLPIEVGAYGLEQEMPLPPSLDQEVGFVARSTFSLDSLVVRATDTLAFLKVQGNLMPTTLTGVEETGHAPMSVRGAFAGSFIWSTGWNAFVAGAVRTRVTMRAATAGQAAGVPVVALRLDLFERLQIRR